MSQPLCDNCGHPLPNAAGPGLYCQHCGEPVGKATLPRGRRCAYRTCQSRARSGWTTCSRHYTAGKSTKQVSS